MRILVLDDDPLLTMILADHLTDRGHRVVPAYDENLGLLFCMKREFDLVLIDYVLPKLNGLEVLARLRQKNRSTRAVMMTGFPELLNEESARMADLNVETVIEKPFSFADLDAIINQQIQKNEKD